MSKLQKPIHKFHCSHAGLRKFLRLVSYGCYHRTLFARHEITPRSYDDFLRQIRFFVPEENLQVTRHDKCSYFTLVGDFRHGTKNYLYPSFLLKTLRSEQCLHKIILLQITAVEKLLSLTEILEQAEDLILNHKPDSLGIDADLTQLLRRRLNELADSGVIRRVKTKNKILFARMSNPLTTLSADEVQSLFIALQFLRNVSLVGTAGYFLCDSLKDFYGTARDVTEIFQFKNNNFARILDDDILLTITEAQRLKQKIWVERENKPSLIVTPVAIETDFLCNRQYLVALKQKDLIRLRVEKITAVRLAKENAENYSATQERLREIRLRVRFKSLDERRQYERLLANELPVKIIDEAVGEFICAIETTDPLQIYPRLWKFQPWAEILSGNNGLRERMKNDAREALKNYAKSV